MKTKKALTIMLAVIIVCTASINSFAREYPENQTSSANNVVTPQWTNTERIDLNLSFSGIQANCSAIVTGKTGTSKITASVILQQKNSNGTYTNVKQWSGLCANGSRLTFNSNYNVNKKYTYRMTINATVYQGSTGENVSHYVENYCS